MRFHFGWKSHFGVQSALYLCSHELRQNETQNGMDFISVILTEMKFQTGMRFSCEHNLLETKWISADWLNVAFNAFNAFKTQCGHGFHITNFDRNEVSFRVIKYHVITNRNKMPTHVHRNIGLFWNAAGMKLHVNRTCFHTGLKSQTGMSSFRLSCISTLIAKRCAGNEVGIKVPLIFYWWNCLLMEW